MQLSGRPRPQKTKQNPIWTTTRTSKKLHQPDQRRYPAGEGADHHPREPRREGQRSTRQTQAASPRQAKRGAATPGGTTRKDNAPSTLPKPATGPSLTCRGTALTRDPTKTGDRPPHTTTSGGPKPGRAGTATNTLPPQKATNHPPPPTASNRSTTRKGGGQHSQSPPPCKERGRPSLGTRASKAENNTQRAHHQEGCSKNPSPPKAAGSSPQQGKAGPPSRRASPGKATEHHPPQTATGEAGNHSQKALEQERQRATQPNKASSRLPPRMAVHCTHRAVRQEWREAINPKKRKGPAAPARNGREQQTKSPPPKRTSDHPAYDSHLQTPTGNGGTLHPQGPPTRIGGGPPRRPPNAWSPGAPAPPGP